LSGIVSLKDSIEAWDQVEALLRRSFETYARTLEHLEQHLSGQAARRFHIEGLDFAAQRAALAKGRGAPGFGLPVLESVSHEVELSLREFSKRLCEHACSSQDLVDVAAVLRQAVDRMLELDGKNERVMRTVAGRLRTANELDNVATLRLIVRLQSAELVRVADGARREHEALAASLGNQVAELTAGLRVAYQEARRDTLTGLLNRRGLEEMMDQFEKRETPRCLILLDLDRFKSINDKFGYLAGDELLRQIALRIQSALLPNCAAARWGGDEFVILVDGSLSVGMSVAQRLDQQLRNRYQLGEGELANVFIQASVGVSDWKPGEDAKHVIQHADHAMKAKKRGAEPAACEPVQ
jgi:diguanylate cyclase (GGDEF)-like protein